MTELTVEMRRVNDAVLMEAENDAGNTIRIDGSAKVGGVDGGFRPMQLLLAGIGGCASIDIVEILRKQKQTPEDFRISVSGEREEGKVPAVFTKIHLHFTLKGYLDEKKVGRAIALGVEKYCSVGEMLGKTAEITHDFEVRR